VVFKLDFRKAFDSISWDALDRILWAKGFSELWCSWVRMLNQTAVLLNGVLVDGSSAAVGCAREIPSLLFSSTFLLMFSNS
jgi:hypothetical protein